jgi:hypothetical protein
MNKANGPIERIKIGLVVGLLAALTGCAAYGGGGYYGDTGYYYGVSEPDMYLFGGDYYRGRDAHNYSHRGTESRGVAHSGGVQSHAAVQTSSVQSRGVVAAAVQPTSVQSHAAVAAVQSTAVQSRGTAQHSDGQRGKR